MYLSDSFKSSFINIFAHKFRSILTMLAIFIGIFAVVIMFSSIYGIKQLISENMEQLGWNNSLIVYPSEGHQTTVSRRVGGMGGRFMYMRRQFRQLNISDYQALKSQVEYSDIYAMIDLWSRIQLPDKQEYIRLRATTPAYFTNKTFPLAAGRFFNSFEESSAARVAVIGHHVAEKYFPGSNPLGEFVSLGENRYRIIGVLAEDELNVGGMNFNQWERRQDLSAVYIPLATGARYLKQDNAIDYIYIQSRDEASFPDLKNRTRQVLLANHKMGHNFSFRDVGTMMLTISEELESVMEKWNITLTAIAAISLLVGGLGLFSTMLISINERMLEIGIRKSVGATSKDIFLHFIMESLLLSLISAAAGIMLAVLSLRVVSLAINFTFPIVTEGILLGLGFAVIIGVLSGFYPALKASDANPIQAIYYNE